MLFRSAEIVSARDKERREIFEEAAGISKFRYRKGEAEKRLAMAEDNLSRLTDILSELEGRVEPLRIQAEKAKTFLELSERKKGLELSIWISDLNESRQRMEEQDNRIQITRRQYGALEAQAESLEQEINDLYQQMQKKIYHKILLCGTGALLSPTSTYQGESIPSICHAVSIEL